MKSHLFCTTNQAVTHKHQLALLAIVQEVSAPERVFSGFLPETADQPHRATASRPDDPEQLLDWHAGDRLLPGPVGSVFGGKFYKLLIRYNSPCCLSSSLRKL